MCGRIRLLAGSWQYCGCCMCAGVLLAAPGVCGIWAWHSLSGADVMLGSLLHPCRPPKALADVRAKLELLLSLLAQVGQEIRQLLLGCHLLSTAIG